MLGNLNTDKLNIQGLSVIEAELVAVSAESSDCAQLAPLVPVLKQLRNILGVELIFVGELRGGVLTGPHRAAGEASACFAETAYGRSLLQMRCGSDRYASMSVTADNGMEAGTLLCSIPIGQQHSNPPSSMKTASRLLAGRIEALTQSHMLN